MSWVTYVLYSSLSFSSVAVHITSNNGSSKMFLPITMSLKSECCDLAGTRTQSMFMNQCAVSRIDPAMLRDRLSLIDILATKLFFSSHPSTSFPLWYGRIQLLTVE